MSGSDCGRPQDSDGRHSGAFVDWAWGYFSRAWPIQILDRSDASRIDWDKDIKSEGLGVSSDGHTVHSLG